MNRSGAWKPGEVFTSAELAEYNGSVEGRPILVAYRGQVYDVTNSFPWRKGFHWGCARAGQDVSDKMGAAPHGPELLERIPCVGILAASARERDES